MGFSLLAEALARMEHKIDLLLTHFKVNTKPMHFYGISCPVCKQQIEYVIDIQQNIVKRKCGCSTNKQPSIQLTPVSSGGKSSGSNTSSSEDTST